MVASANLEPVWKDIVSGKMNIEFEFLAARILQSALVRSFHQQPSPMRLDRCARELRELFLQNLNLPSARNDLDKVLGTEAQE
ncbi:MAG TPA: hypothetical protein VJ995_01485 [Geothermobacteraceae bacterium]|nr:hypothetical protein [Geothermobacteraceae bacterium]